MGGKPTTWVKGKTVEATPSLKKFERDKEAILGKGRPKKQKTIKLLEGEGGRGVEKKGKRSIGKEFLGLRRRREKRGKRRFGEAGRDREALEGVKAGKRKGRIEGCFVHVSGLISTFRHEKSTRSGA